MVSKFKTLWIYLFTLCGFLRGISSRGHYTAVAPGTVRSNSDYIVAVSLDDFGGESCWFRIIVTPFCKSTGPSSAKEVDQLRRLEVEVQPNSTKLVKLSMPKLTHSCGKLEIHSFRGIIDYHEAKLHVEPHDFTVFIQTDKAKFKPGELMQFRAICIDHLTRPAEVIEVLDMFIYDGDKNLIKKFSNIKLVQGVFRGSLQLSEYPVLGDWRIQVNADGHIVQEKIVAVARYQIAKFSVEIETKQEVPLDDGKINVKVKAGYTYDKPVKGNLTVTIHKKYSLYGYGMEPVTKHSPFDGEATMSFDLDPMMTSDADTRKFIQYTLGVIAKVTNSLTAETNNATTEVHIYRLPYKIHIKTASYVNPGELFNITVFVEDLQGNPVGDDENPVTISMAPMSIEPGISSSQSHAQDFQPDEPPIAFKTAYLNENGLAKFAMEYPTNSNQSDLIVIFGVRAEYLNCTSYWKGLNEMISNTFHLDVLTEKPKVGQQFEIEISSEHPIHFFIYEIISQGDIIEGRRVHVPGNDTKYLLRLNATHNMVPKIIFFMHRILKSVIDSQVKEIYIQRDSQNSIKIDADPEAKPKASVSINVTTDKDSYIGLMGIDQSLVLDTKTDSDLSENTIYTKLRRYDSINMNNVIYPGAEAGLVTFSNAINRAGYGIDVGVGSRFGSDESLEPADFEKPTIKLPNIRKLFSESWIFQDFERSSTGSLMFRKIVPDTITSWVLTGFSLNSKTGLALTKNAAKVRVFQKFFISFDLPNLVKAGELIEIPVYIFNYLDEDLSAKVTIESSKKELELQPNQTISKSISAKGSEKLLYYIKPTKPGRYMVTVMAVSRLGSDVVQKMLTVETGGIPYSFSKSYLVHFLRESEQEDEISVDIPDSAIVGSESLHLSVVGDIFGSLMNGIEKLVRVPHGNGADNLRLFVSNLLVLKYLTALNLSIPVIESKAKLHLELGYQNQFAFKHLDGSFGILDRKVGRTGDIWLTSYTIWALQQAQDYIEVNAEVIDRGLTFLKKKQCANGGFYSEKSTEEDATLTGFTMLAFLAEEKYRNEYKDTISKGLKYLYDALDSLKESSSTAMSTYALVLAKHEKSEELLAKLSTNAGLTSRPLMWEKSDSILSKLESTAYSFMSLLESHEKSIRALLPIMKSLLSSGGLDGSVKTSAHIVALLAMVKFAKDINVGRKDLRVKCKDDFKMFPDFHITKDNAQVLQSIELNKRTRNIRLQSRGVGFALIEVKYTYNLASENHSLSTYKTNVTLNESTDSKATLKVCVATDLAESHNNVTTMKVNLRTGLSIDESSFGSIMLNIEQVKAIEMNEDFILVWFENITQSGICIPFEVTKKFNVSNSKPCSVIVYDAYNDDQQSISFYEYNTKR